MANQIQVWVVFGDSAFRLVSGSQYATAYTWSEAEHLQSERRHIIRGNKLE